MREAQGSLSSPPEQTVLGTHADAGATAHAVRVVDDGLLPDPLRHLLPGLRGRLRDVEHGDTLRRAVPGARVAADADRRVEEDRVLVLRTLHPDGVHRELRFVDVKHLGRGIDQLLAFVYRELVACRHRETALGAGVRAEPAEGALAVVDLRT